MLKLKKVLMVCLVSAAFLSAGRMAFADGVSGSDLLNYEISTETVQVIHEDSAEAEQVIQKDSAEAEQVIQKDSAEAEQVIQKDSAEAEQVVQKDSAEAEQVIHEDSAEAEQNSEATILLSDNDDEEKPSENDTQEEPVKILRQPEDRIFIPGVNIAFSLQAQGTGLQYQWYYKKRGQSEFKPWKNHTRSGESVAPDESWDGIELYCEVTDEKGNTVRSDTVMACIGDTKKILAVGDSICRGSRNGYRGFVGDLGLPYINAGQNRAALSVGVNDVTDIPTLLTDVTDFDPDIIIAEGGVNDYVFNAPLGTTPSVRLNSTSDLDDKILGTAMGGLQKLLLTMSEKYPDAQQYYLITHRITQRQGKKIDGSIVYSESDKYVDWTSKQNKNGYTQQDIHDAIVTCCQLYGVEVIDIYNDSELDTANLNYCSKVSYLLDHSITDTNYVDIDGIHPLSLGYSEFYVPAILQHIDTSQPVKELAIIEQPVDQTINVGDSLTLSLKAEGSFLKYQWYFKKKGQTDFRPWPNRVLPSETVTPNITWNGIQLYCVVTDKRGNFIQSDTVTVTFDDNIEILQQPENQTVALGDSITLSVKAEGTGLSYQWYYKKEGQDSFSPYRTNGVETVTPNATWDGIQLYCVVTDIFGNSIQSETVTVTVEQPLEITQQPVNSSVNLGEALTLSVTAQGIGLSYQWYFKKKGQTDFRPWPNRVRATETVTPNISWNGIQLYCVVTDKRGNSIQSETVTVTVEQPLEITQQPVNSSVNLGEALTLSVKAQGIGLSYQWYYKKEGQTDFRPWPNRIRATETVTPNISWNGIQLYCVVTDKRGNSIQSETVTVTFDDNIEILQQPENQTVALGDSITLSVKAEGTGLKYRWYYKKEGQDSFSPYRTNGVETVTPNATWDGIQLYCVVTDMFGNSVQSETVTVTVEQPLEITQQPVNSSVNLGEALTLSVKAQGIGLSYQWYYKKEGQTDFNIWKNHTNASESITPNESWDGIQLYCVVTDKRGNSIQSEIVTVKIIKKNKIAYPL